MNTVCLNGKFLPSDRPVLLADNKGYRYGDGLFETVRVWKRELQLADYHFERFFAGLQLLRFEVPALLTRERLRKQILLLCARNNCDEQARVRLSVFRGNGGIFEGGNELQYLIECWPLATGAQQLNENGLVIGVFPDARKSCDVFSNIKSANYLPYTMAARYARERQLNECLVLNTHGRICDGTIANIFLVKGERILTPALSEGCVEGVMRRHLLTKLAVEEVMMTMDDLQTADEIFLTNAIQGIRWVRQLDDRIYQSAVTGRIFDAHLKTI